MPKARKESLDTRRREAMLEVQRICHMQREATLEIQQVCRSHLAKLKLKALAATKIQRCYRTYCWRRRMLVPHCSAEQDHFGRCSIVEPASQETWGTAGSLENRGTEILAAALLQVKFLTRLDLRGSNLGARGARLLASALRGAQALQRLGLAWNAIGDDGVAAIPYALRVGRLRMTLQELDLAHNRISCAGALVLEATFQRCSQLLALDLRGNCIGREAAERLVSRGGQSLRLLVDVSWSTRPCGESKPLARCMKGSKKGCVPCRPAVAVQRQRVDAGMVATLSVATASRASLGQCSENPTGIRAIPRAPTSRAYPGFVPSRHPSTRLARSLSTGSCPGSVDLHLARER